MPDATKFIRTPNANTSSLVIDVSLTSLNSGKIDDEVTEFGRILTPLGWTHLIFGSMEGIWASFTRVGFIVTNLARPAQRVVAFYNPARHGGAMD
jgi:hypothetical protein